MADVLHLCNHFLTYITALVVANALLTDLRHGCRLIDIHAVNWNSSLRP